MFKTVKMLTAFVALFGAIKKLVLEVEVPGYGPKKKAVILECLATFIDTAEVFMDLPKEVFLKVADQLIDIIVSFYNLVGILKHK